MDNQEFQNCSIRSDCGDPDATCQDNICMCIDALKPKERNEQCGKDTTDHIECASDKDCAMSSTTCRFDPYLNKFVCLCVSSLKAAKADGSCNEDQSEITGKNDVFNLSSVVESIGGNVGSIIGDGISPSRDITNINRTNNKVKIIGDDISPSRDTINVNRTSNKTSDTDPYSNTFIPGGMKEDTVIPQDFSLMQVFIPLSSILVVILVLSVILYRRSKLCKRKHVRKDAVIKSNEDIQLLDRMNFVNKNPSYFLSTRTGLNTKKVFVNEIPIDRVQVLDVVGEGAFGQVFRGNYLATEEDDSKSSVAVKVLKEGVSNEVREDFQREVEIMSAFDHDNILKLLGVITRGVEETPYMIFEYMIHGDLAEMLRRNDPVMRKNGHDIVLQKTDLIDIATQIANGMKYLTSQHFVHRDLATRNCLVGESLIVKISDFGMARDVYTCDYYRIGGSRMLPVRWMSPESVKYGRFTTESDIWAYGVVLWEIFSYGRQPYYGHSNEEVVRFLDEGILLQRPEECPSTAYHLMLGCWKTNPKERLLFSRIYSHFVDYSKQVVRNAHNMHTVDIDSDNEMIT